MPRFTALQAAVLALVCTPLIVLAQAQEPQQPPAPPALPMDNVHRLTLTLPHLAQAGAPTMDWRSSDGANALAWHELATEGVVKGAPYCATAVHERIQVLADGNRITKKQTTGLCRDGEGRTRREVQREGGPRLVYLNDPVAKESWVLDPEAKTARRLAVRTQIFTSHGTSSMAPPALREQAERWRDWAKDVAEQARRGVTGQPGQVHVERRVVRPGAEPGVVLETEVTTAAPGASGADARPEVRREVRVIRLSDLPHSQAPAAPMAPMPPMPPIPLGDLPGLLPRGEAVTTALPPKEIEGVRVDGARTTWTLEAGKIGNERPIVTTREVWRSPELMLVVSSREADPRSGEVVYRLEKLKRGEPDASLMKPPADYTRPAPPAPRPKAPAASDTRRG